MTMSKLKGLIFDCDGTMVENSRYHAEIFARMVEKYHGKVQFNERLFGMKNENIFQEMFPEICATVGWQAVADEKEALYRDTYGPVLKPVKGLVELLKDARAEGLRCSIGSSACRANVEFHMDVCGVRDYIDDYLCMEDVKFGKPDPWIYNECCRRLGLEPEECIVFEDATSGIEAGVRAGCPVVAIATTSPAEFLRKNTGASLVVDDFSFLNMDILRSLTD